MDKPLHGVLVLDLSTGIAGAFSTKALADLGAEVIKVEPPGGDPARRLPPLLDAREPMESSVHFLYLNTNKKSITLDLETAAGQLALDRLVTRADVCVESFPPAESQRLNVFYSRLSAANPRLVVTSITPFGSAGPYRDYHGAEIVYQAMGGFMHLSGGYGREPLQVALDQAQLTAGRYAAVATLAALYHQRRSGNGQHVDVSIFESVVMLPPFHIANYSYTGTVQGRGPQAVNVMDGDYLKCHDGYVCLTTGGGNTLEQWALFFDLPGLLAPEFETAESRLQNWQELEAMFDAALGKLKRHDFIQAAMDRRFVVGAVQAPEELLACPQLRERRALVQVVHPVAGTHRYPGPGYQLDGVNPAEGSSPAPLLSQHTDQVLESLETQAAERVSPKVADDGGRRPSPARALEGVRVLVAEDFVALPVATMLLADLGAEVIRVEAPARMVSRRFGPFPGGVPGPQWWNETATLGLWFRSKKSVALNLQTPQGQDIFRRLAAVSDVVASNFRTDVMRRLGLDYQSLRQVKPDLVMLNLSGFGGTGPWRGYGAFARTIDGYTGLSHLTGHTGGPPVRANPTYMDMTGGLVAAQALLAGLLHKQTTGRGLSIDLSMYEAGITAVGPALLEVQVTGVSPARAGNRHRWMAPHGCYPCRGDDSWVVIAVESAQAWWGLRQALGNPAWALDSRFDTSEGRWHHQAEIDQHIAAWTSQRDQNNAFHRLQAAGVAAGPVLHAKNLLLDPHLRAREFFERLAFPQERVGTRLLPSRPYHFSRTPASAIPGPAFGEHNIDILCGLLDLSLQEVDALVTKGAVATEPSAEEREPPPAPSPEAQLHSGALYLYDVDYKRVLGLEPPLS